MPMRRSAIILVAAALLQAMSVSAQVLAQVPPGTTSLSPPLPPPPPPPKIEIPKIPKMDELPSRNYVKPSTRPSFGDRVSKCLDDGAAAGMGPNERSTYSRNCANR
jgi:hypothetical protein